ncbi:hypothetical protein KAF80_02835 [Bacillus sp. WL1]|uniref:hypothetical protein n=1 Tax=Bacillus sp. WL1 TaxID=2822693 RepID=UPI001B32A224|nr:hypothetical protein [Bacillus sp. WL1]MBP3967981.1 hypothetical protein [Bacillus sp. WL1]
MKFGVLKVEDVLKVSSQSELAVLDGIVRKIGIMREEEGRNPEPKYYVVNQDEPYAEEVLNIIKKHEGEI